MKLSEDQARAVLDALSYYKMCDYGHGDQRPLDDEQEEHRQVIDEAEARLERMIG